MSRVTPCRRAPQVPPPSLRSIHRLLQRGSFMFLWRGVKGVSEAERRLDDELAQIEDRAEQEGVSQRATLYKRAGDLCAEFKGREKLAVSYYGKAIDGYIRSHMYEAAGVLCRKLIRFSPEVVRAHFTLAALAILDRRVGDAAGEITSYVHAARRTRTERLAIPVTADGHLVKREIETE